MHCSRLRTAAVITLLALMPAAAPALAAEPALPRPAALPGTTPGLLSSDTNTGILPADTAFPLTALVEADGSVALLWEPVEGYYLYRDSVQVTGADGTGLAIELPAATIITDEFFGEVAVYKERLLARLPAAELQPAPGATLTLQLHYQGCATGRYCYPPQEKTVTVNFP